MFVLPAFAVRSPGYLGEGDSARIRIIDGETEITVPMRAIYMLRDILNGMANGNSVTIRPFHEELTMQEAADFLNVSRPYFTKSILDKGLLPYIVIYANVHP